MANDTNSKTAHLTTLFNERIKTHNVYDGQSRLWKTYEASVDAEDGGPCLLTEYIFTSPTSGDVEGFKEVVGVWDESWEDDFTV